jgi:hypothetical protein
LVGEERDVAAPVVKTEKAPLSVHTLICKVGGPGAQRGGVITTLLSLTDKLTHLRPDNFFLALARRRSSTT